MKTTTVRKYNENRSGSQKPSRITRQKTCCASESNTSIRVVFANQSGFDALIAVNMAWEERGSCINIFRMENRGWITETFMNYEAKDLLRKSVDHVLTYSGRQIAVGYPKPSGITREKTCCASESNTSVRVVFANRSGFDAPIAVDMAWGEHGSCINVLQLTNRGRISETFSNYEAKDLLRKDLDELRGKILVAQVSQTRRFALYLRIVVVLMLQLQSTRHGRSVDHVLTYFGRQIMVGSQKPSRITRQKTSCASESNTSVRVVFANRSGFDAPITVDIAWEERGSCINILETKNCGHITETFTNYEAKDLLRKSVDHVLTYSRQQIAVGSQKPSRITRQKTCCASKSHRSFRIVLANRSDFHAPIGVVLAWQERGSCLNIFRTKNRSRILETFTNYEAKDLLRNESNTSVRVVFANRSGFDAPIAVDMAWEERGSCINIFRTTNRGLISETFTNYEAKDLLRKQKTRCASESNTSVRVVHANQSGFDAPIGVDMAWEEPGSCVNIFWTTKRCRISETFTNYEAKDLLHKSQKPSQIMRQKTCCASESNTSVRDVFANGSGFDAPILVVLAWEERGSCLNIFRTTNCGRISETFTNYEANVLLRNELNTSVRVVFANQSGFDAPIAVNMAWEEHGSCLNIFRTTNRGRISETFMNYEAKDLLRKSVDHVLTYSGQKIVVGSQKPSRITRQKTGCGSESNVSVRIVFANRSGFDAPIPVVFAWEEHGSCLNIFRTTNRGRISETFMIYEAKDLLRK
ncbi:uncharacterized protein G2W53_014296 [Senna tora]|uniref:Uncharacterized protein n=1 Tax=Senna tora TaxID=362788 RepID=A0A834WT86_9FABA|nr:uncharacterized protein G2W53_014296 [Senna tora]